jgi:hypothetical protein
VADVATALAAAKAAGDECAAAGLSRAKWDAVTAALGGAPVFAVPDIVSIPLNDSAITADLVQYSGGRYDRNQDPLIFAPGWLMPGASKGSTPLLTSTGAINLPFQLTNQAAGGEQRAPLPYVRYSLRVVGIAQGADGKWRANPSGVERASYTPFWRRGPLTFTGTMPFGMKLASDGTISGTPTTTGAKDVTVTATLPTGEKVSTAVLMVVGSTSATMYASRPPIGQVGVPYSYSFFGKPFEAAGVFTGALGNEPDGLYFFDIYGIDANGAARFLMRHGGFIDRNGEAKNSPVTITQNGSRDWESMAQGGQPIAYQYAIVPVSVMQTNRTKPLVPRLGPVFSTMPADAKNWMRLTYLIPHMGVDHQLCYTRSGVPITENLQYYHWTRLIDPKPSLPLLDGPRGVCTVPFTTHLLFGRNGKLYGLNPWQCWVMDATGAKRTLYGIRHKYAPYWHEGSLDGPEVEYVGDWDASIPATERYAWESWGMVWDDSSVLTDDSAAIPPGETEKPHIGLGPRHFVTDRHGYVLNVQFSAVAHGNNPVNPQPAKITRWCKVSDPWGIAADQVNRVLYVSERGADRISMWSMDTPDTYLGTFATNPNPGSYGSVNAGMRLWTGAGTSVTRAVDCVAPEGLQILDGYVYWGSIAQKEVRRKPMAGGPIEIVCRPTIDNNSNYVFLAISEGQFGPRGTLAIATWSNGNVGRPKVYVPGPKLDTDGVQVTHTEWPKFAGYRNGVLGGRGPNWDSGSYASACAFGYRGNPARTDDPPYGAFAITSASGELFVHVQADATDPPAVDYVKADAGEQKFFARYQILYGPYGNGPDLPLPWGADPDVDYYMDAVCGLR